MDNVYNFKEREPKSLVNGPAYGWDAVDYPEEVYDNVTHNTDDPVYVYDIAKANATCDTHFAKHGRKRVKALWYTITSVLITVALLTVAALALAVFSVLSTRAIQADLYSAAEVVSSLLTSTGIIPFTRSPTAATEPLTSYDIADITSSQSTRSTTVLTDPTTTSIPNLSSVTETASTTTNAGTQAVATSTDPVITTVTVTVSASMDPHSTTANTDTRTDNTSTTDPARTTTTSSTEQPLTTLETATQFLTAEYPIGSVQNPATSCSEIPTTSLAGEYWIQPSNTTVQVFCDTNVRDCSCDEEPGWMRIAYLDMKDPFHECPNGFTLRTRTEPPLRVCGRSSLTCRTCLSTTYSSHGVQYSKVCGRIIGYQLSMTDGFYRNRRPDSLDDNYVDGVSLTYGSPRQHIWTFASAIDETWTYNDNCPCIRSDSHFEGDVPSFIGQDYFCATGSQSRFLIIHSTLVIHSGMGRDVAV